MKPAPILTALSLALAVQNAPARTPAPPHLDRTVLPIKEPARETTKTLDVRKATPPSRFEVKAPEGAPNVLLVLIDDLGFAGTSAFGGPVSNPPPSTGSPVRACCTITSTPPPSARPPAPR
jgi:arylsulfatase